MNRKLAAKPIKNNKKKNEKKKQANKKFPQERLGEKIYKKYCSKLTGPKFKGPFRQSPEKKNRMRAKINSTHFTRLTERNFCCQRAEPSRLAPPTQPPITNIQKRKVCKRK